MTHVNDRERRLEARLQRERRARREAERLLESKSRELYDVNRALSRLADDLEERVEARTLELSLARQMAVEKAEVDALTGVCNRSAFDKKLSEALARGERLMVVVIDLDDFKSVNDTLGHAAGDALLVEFAARLQQASRLQDIVGRLGGDEFALVARSMGNRNAALSMSHRLLRALCQPMLINGRSITCSCSFGIAESESRPCTPDGLLSDADLALYASKRTGPGCITFFESTLRIDLERRAALDTEIRGAVHDNQLEPWYQPIWTYGKDGYVGAEVLARWRCPDGSVRSPATFLNVVEELGLLDAMMDGVLRIAFEEAAPKIRSGALGYLSINVAPSQFDRGWTQSQLPKLLAETQFPARALVVEITETALIHNLERTRKTLEALTSQGIHIALDDFGVGYSNFSLLGKLPFDILKLDKTLISGIETDSNARALAECVLSLASRLNIKVVAEGVETQQQSEMLIASGCRTMQGYWIARPHRNLPSTVSATETFLPL